MDQHQRLEAIQFQLQHIAGMHQISSQACFEHVDEELIAMMLDQASRFAEETLAPLAASGDVEGCKLEEGRVKLPPGTKEAYRQWCDLGFPALGLPLEMDGLGLPHCLQAAIQEICDGGNLAFGMLPINLKCAAQVLMAHAPAELQERWLAGLISGEIASTIAISEAQAGSDAGRIRTKASPETDGSWKITGSKLWISYGDHDACEQIIHLVLARVPGDAVGTRGLGLFAVPKYRNDDISNSNRNGVMPMRLEHKMGLHASPTCVLEFEDAQGYLIGEAGKGLQALFIMMNGMRLAVGVQGAAIANAATGHAIDYARNRPQGGRPDQAPVMISQHPDVARMLLEMTAQGELLRALSLRTAAFLDLAAGCQDQDQAEQLRQQAELLLPLAKTLGAEQGFEVANLGIQVLGGYGYTNDYPLERMARDIRVAAIYEGTSGIQALDFLKRKVLGDEAASLQEILGRIKSSLDKADPNNPLSTPLHQSLGLYEGCLKDLLEKAVADSHHIPQAAYAFLRLSGLLVSGWNALDLYHAADGDSEYQKRLRASLSLFAVELEAQSRLWAAKTEAGLPDFQF